MYPLFRLRCTASHKVASNSPPPPLLVLLPAFTWLQTAPVLNPPHWISVLRATSSPLPGVSGSESDSVLVLLLRRQDLAFSPDYAEIQTLFRAIRAVMVRTLLIFSKQLWGGRPISLFSFFLSSYFFFLPFLFLYKR